MLFILMAGPLNISTSSSAAWFCALNEDRLKFERDAGESIRSITFATFVMQDALSHARCIKLDPPSGRLEDEFRLHQYCIPVATGLALNAVDRLISTGPAGGLITEAAPGTWVRVEK